MIPLERPWPQAWLVFISWDTVKFYHNYAKDIKSTNKKINRNLYSLEQKDWKTISQNTNMVGHSQYGWLFFSLFLYLLIFINVQLLLLKFFEHLICTYLINLGNSNICTKYRRLHSKKAPFHPALLPRGFHYQFLSFHSRISKHTGKHGRMYILFWNTNNSVLYTLFCILLLFT